jgi:cobalt-zinc-cadmium efflux system outer membrane protein
MKNLERGSAHAAGAVAILTDRSPVLAQDKRSTFQMGRSNRAQLAWAWLKSCPGRSALLVVALVLPLAANAKPLTFEAALAQARVRAPSMLAKALSVQAAQSAVDAAGRLPDPKASVAVESFPITGPLAFRPNQDNFTWVKFSFSQDIPNAAKRHAQIERAQSDVVVANAEGVVTARAVEVGAALAWINLAYAQRRLAALDGVTARLGRYVGATPSAVASGKARPAQVLAGRLALAMLADRRSERAAEMGRARAELTRWTGDPDPQIAGLLPDLAVDPDKLRAGLDHHPTVAMSGAQAGQADADLTMARAEKHPDFGVDLAYLRRDPRFGDYVSAGVTVSLPLFAKHRQNPLIAAASARASAARAEQDATKQALAADLDAGLADHVMHHDQWVRARDTLEPLAQERVALETASYGAGRASLTEVVDAHVALADAVLMTLDREAAVASDAARLTLTYRSGNP